MSVFCDVCLGECLAVSGDLSLMDPAHLASSAVLELVLAREGLSYTEWEAVDAAVEANLRLPAALMWPIVEEDLAAAVTLFQSGESIGVLTSKEVTDTFARWFRFAASRFSEYIAIGLGSGLPVNVAAAVAHDPCPRSEADADARWKEALDALPWGENFLSARDDSFGFVTTLGIGFGRAGSPAALARAVSLYAQARFPLSFAISGLDRRLARLHGLEKSIALLSPSGREFVAAHAPAWASSAESLVSAASLATAPVSRPALKASSAEGRVFGV